MGICGCGVADTDTDDDGTADCNDACPSDPAKVAAGVCGCGVADIDTDDDGTADCVDECPDDVHKIAVGICGCSIPDIDSDEDGIADCQDPFPNSSVQGDTNHDGVLSLHDAILALQATTGAATDTIEKRADINSDDTIGMIELLYILQMISMLR